MTKNGNTFKEENVYIHSNNIYIKIGFQKLISYNGTGDDVDFPYCFTNDNNVKVRLFQPLTRTLSKGNTYKFELRCDLTGIICLRLENERDYIEMDKNNNIYTKTLKIDSSTTSNLILIYYRSYRSNSSSFYYSLIYKYILS